MKKAKPRKKDHFKADFKKAYKEMSRKVARIPGLSKDKILIKL